MIQAALRAISGWFHQHSVPVPGLLAQVCVVTVTVQVVGRVSNRRREERVDCVTVTWLGGIVSIRGHCSRG